MKTTSHRIYILGLCICLTGCITEHFTKGTDFNTANANQIAKGTTASNAIISMFGPPLSKTPEPNGGERWIYDYETSTIKAHADYGAAKADSTGGKKTLNILFDKNGVVVNFLLDEGPTIPVNVIDNPDAKRVVTTGHDFEKSKVDQIIKGKTTAEQISSMFGVPSSKEPEVDDSQRWEYTYETLTTPHGLFSDGKSMEYTKNLKILIGSNGIVSTYTFSEGPGMIEK